MIMGKIIPQIQLIKINYGPVRAKKILQFSQRSLKETLGNPKQALIILLGLLGLLAFKENDHKIQEVKAIKKKIRCQTILMVLLMAKKDSTILTGIT